MNDPQCPLCKDNFKRVTFWYYENQYFVICDCIACKVPMYVWRSHNFPSREQARQMIDDAECRFPGKTIDVSRRQVPNHFHFHVR